MDGQRMDNGGEWKHKSGSPTPGFVAVPSVVRVNRAFLFTECSQTVHELALWSHIPSHHVSLYCYNRAITIWMVI